MDSGHRADPGFFTSISSNGTSNPIIWAISRSLPNTNNGAPISLYAFNPESGGSDHEELFQARRAHGRTGGNANLVPVVANGLVFVASNKQLQIFGLSPNRGIVRGRSSGAPRILLISIPGFRGGSPEEGERRCLYCTNLQ